jgi:hypothetical protein
MNTVLQASVDARLEVIEDLVKAMRCDLATLTRAVERLAERQSPAREPQEPLRGRRIEDWRCRWFGHQPGPTLGLHASCSRCGVIYRIGRGL